jgi:crotonobetaine/carnitine-CoA ligase
VPRSDRLVVPVDAPSTFPEWIRSVSDRLGDKTVLDVCGDVRTAADLNFRTDCYAAGLTSLGLVPGDHVGVMMHNSIENVEIWFGIQKAGLVEVPVHTASRGALLQYLLDHADVRALVVDESLMDRVAEILDSLPQLEHLIVNSSAATHISSNHVAFHQLSDLFQDVAPPRLQLSTHSTAVILHTSGTTGPPKGVVLSHGAVLHLTRHIVWLMDYVPSDRLYTTFPLFHNNAKYTSVTAALECGGSLVMDKKFSASGFWSTCRDKEVTAFNYMGAMLMMLYKQDASERDLLNSVRTAFGAPCPVHIWEDFESRFGLSLVEVYGMTESPMACETRLESRKIGTAGQESTTYQVMIADEDDQAVGPDVPGEILIRPKVANAIFSSYYKKEEETVEAWRNLWFHTGDQGSMDNEGFLTFIDRKKDCIRRRGENISSWEIESAVNSFSKVVESAAFGIDSDLSEAEVMVAVVPRDKETFDLSELIEHCRGQMSDHAVPRYVRLVEELPKNHAQRVEKYRLRAEGLTAETWDRLAEGSSN